MSCSCGKGSDPGYLHDASCIQSPFFSLNEALQKEVERKITLHLSLIPIERRNALLESLMEEDCIDCDKLMKKCVCENVLRCSCGMRDSVCVCRGS